MLIFSHTITKIYIDYSLTGAYLLQWQFKEIFRIECFLEIRQYPRFFAVDNILRECFLLSIKTASLPLFIGFMIEKNSPVERIIF